MKRYFPTTRDDPCQGQGSTDAVDGVGVSIQKGQRSNEDWEKLYGFDPSRELLSVVASSFILPATVQDRLKSQRSQLEFRTEQLQMILKVVSFFIFLVHADCNSSSSPRPFSKPRLRLRIWLMLAWPRGCFDNCACFANTLRASDEKRSLKSNPKPKPCF